MRPSLLDWALLGALVAIWGTAFLAIAIAVESLPPASLVALRVGVAALVLCVAVRALGMRLPGPGPIWARFLLLGCVGNALPFTAISWGQLRVSSGLTGVLMAVMPLATLVLAHYFVAGEKMTPRRTAGFGLGFAGIGVLVGPAAMLQLGGDGTEVTHQLAVLLGALCYAVNTILAGRMPPMHALVQAAGTMLMSSAVMLPIALVFDRPWEWPVLPSGTSWAAGLWLGLVPTGLATFLYFRIVSSAGPTFLALMNYGIPVVAMGAGIALAGEPFEPRALLALTLILGGLIVSQRAPQRRPEPARRAG